MKQMTRRLGMLLVAGAALTLVGCGNSAQPSGESDDKVGQLSLPLATQGASGVTYRLRDATFNVHQFSYGYPAGVGSGVGSGVGGGSGGGFGGGQVITVSSETDPDAQTISLALEEGEYYVELLPGWHFEKLTGAGAVVVEATLLSGETQWVWVSRRSTSFAEFSFGLGGRELWLNGDLNIGVVLYEDPSELNGFGGSAGAGGGMTAGSGGFVTGGAGGFGPLP